MKLYMQKSVFALQSKFHVFLPLLHSIRICCFWATAPDFDMQQFFDAYFCCVSQELGWAA